MSTTGPALNGPWFLTGLPTTFVVVEFMVAQIDEYVTGTLSAIVNGVSHSWRVSGNAVGATASLNFAGETGTFTFASTAATATGYSGTLSGAYTGAASLVPTDPSGGSAFDGEWTIQGLPATYSVVTFFVSQIDAYVAGTLVLAVAGGTTSYTVAGNATGTSVSLTFFTPNAPPVLTFSGTLQANGTVTGTLSGLVSGPATLAPAF